MDKSNKNQEQEDAAVSSNTAAKKTIRVFPGILLEFQEDCPSSFLLETRESTTGVNLPETLPPAQSFWDFEVL